MNAIEYKGQKVITTELLAQVYGTDTRNISKNFNRNKSKFIEGKHYFLLQGDELKAFKGSRHLDDNLKFTPILYLWTGRGANRHSKILDTDKAWEQFENLEETYFRVKHNMMTLPNPTNIKYLNGVANYLRVQRSIMKDKGCTPYEVAQMDKLTCDTYGIPVPECLITPSTWEQLILPSPTPQELIGKE